MFEDRELKQYDRWGVPRPVHLRHGEDSLAKPISDNLRSLNPRNWRQMGNLLICDTDFGSMTQTIPIDKLLAGIDENGLPVFKNVIYSNQQESTEPETKTKVRKIK